MHNLKLSANLLKVSTEFLHIFWDICGAQNYFSRSINVS